MIEQGDIPPLTAAEVAAMLSAAGIEVATNSPEFAIYMQYITGIFDELAAPMAEAERQALLGVIQRNPPPEVLEAIRARAISNARDLITNVTQAELSKIQQQIAEQTALGKGPREVARWLDEVKGLDNVRAQSYRKYLEELQASDLSDAEIERRAEAYYQSLLRDRRETIARTEMRKATSGVAAEQAKLSGAKMKVWLTVGDDRVSDQCQADEAAGPIPIDEAFPSGNMETPGHPNCLVPETPVFAPDKISALVATYDGPVFKLSYSNGRWITVTPNHMLLTPHGFIMAKHLRQGDHVVYSPFADRFSASHPNYNDGPSSIEKVVVSLSESSGVFTTRVPVSTKNLHGDGRFCDRYIDIVSTGGFLRDAINSSVFEAALKINFNMADADLLGFPRLRDFASMLFTLALSSDSSMGARRERGAIFNAHLRHPDFVRLASAACFDRILAEDSIDNVTSNTEMIGDSKNRIASPVHSDNIIGGDLRAPVTPLDSILPENFINQRNADIKSLGNALDRFSSDIELACITSVERLHYSGHVYDLQSCSTVYTAGGILSSNCRCTVSYYANEALTPIYADRARDRAAATAAAKGEAE